jgi:Icc-related predicted phosphoesterase
VLGHVDAYAPASVQLLVVSDLHYSLRQLDWVVSVAGDFDLVVVAGDHLDIASIVDPAAQIAVTLEYLARVAKKTSVIACSGNHDLDATDADDERHAAWLHGATGAGVAVDGSSVELDGCFVTVCPWWDGPRAQARVDAQLRRDAALVGDRTWVWVYHAPPAGSPTSWTGRRHYGDAELTAWIEQHHPFLVVCGHVHQAPFADGGGWVDRLGATWVVNAGRQRGPVPAHVIVDTDRREASWASLEGIETRPLGDVQYSG